MPYSRVQLGGPHGHVWVQPGDDLATLVQGLTPGQRIKVTFEVETLLRRMATWRKANAP